MTLPVIGIDPGSEHGGVALLDPDGRTAALVGDWTRLDRRGGEVYRVRFGHRDECLARDLPAVGALLFHELFPKVQAHGAVLVVEGLFVPKAGRGGRPVNPQSVIPLAESAGVMLGHLGSIARETHRPLSSTWRADVLGLATRTPADQAEALAVRMAPSAFDGVGELARVGHVAEALFLARWGWTQQRSAHAA